MLPNGLLKEYGYALSMAIRVMDMAVVFVAGVVLTWAKFGSLVLPDNYLNAILLGMLLTPIICNFFAIYSSIRAKSFISHVFSLSQAICSLAFILAGIAFFTKSGESYSRLWFANWMGFTLALLILYRCTLLIALRFMRQRGWNERRVVIFGAGELGTKFATAVQQAVWTGFRVTAFIDDNAAQKATTINGVAVMQTPANLSQFFTEQKTDELWLALPLRAETRVKAIMHDVRHITINVRFVLDIFGLNLLNHSVDDVAGFPVLNISSTPMMGANRLIKAIEDRFLAFAILVSISPLLILIAAAVKLSSSGPIFFKQNRLGWDGRVINVYKFRTMYVHQEHGGKVTQATAHDARITPLGRFLRRTSLDELPQFINVLQGRMSIVGPRPHALAHNEQYKESINTYMQRHRVKPGITGWAQINGWRGETDTLAKMQKRVEYDLYYINNWSLGFDLKIIMLTFFKGFISRNAY